MIGFAERKADAGNMPGNKNELRELAIAFALEVSDISAKIDMRLWRKKENGR